MAPPFLSFETRDALMQAASARIVSALREGLDRKGAACGALSGGSTPAPAYEALARQPLDWTRVTIALVDERFVPPGDASSNEGLLRRTLARPLTQGARIAPLWSDAPLAHAAAEADRVYAALHLDIALMGMGEDGHTASWFPAARDLREALDPANPRSVMAMHAADAAGSSERLTMTLPAIARADRVVLLITGAAKRARYEASVTDVISPVGALAAACGKRFETLWAP